MAVGAVVLAVLAVCALSPLPNLIAARLSRDERPTPADAIVVLAGGGVWPGDVLSDVSLRRAMRGIVLFHQGFAPLLVLSGSTPDDGRGEAELRAEMAQALGVPATAILASTASFTTRDEAAAIGSELRARGARRILLVSDGLHLRRAAPLFERVGLAVVAVSTNDGAQPAATPDARLGLLYRVAQEVAALVYYRVIGGV